jgi:hypothetical protein
MTGRTARSNLLRQCFYEIAIDESARLALEYLSHHSSGLVNLPRTTPILLYPSSARSATALRKEFGSVNHAADPSVTPTTSMKASGDGVFDTSTIVAVSELELGRVIEVYTAAEENTVSQLGRWRMKLTVMPKMLERSTATVVLPVHPPAPGALIVAFVAVGLLRWGQAMPDTRLRVSEAS